MNYYEILKRGEFYPSTPDIFDKTYEPVCWEELGSKPYNLLCSKPNTEYIGVSPTFPNIFTRPCIHRGFVGVSPTFPNIPQHSPTFPNSTQVQTWCIHVCSSPKEICTIHRILGASSLLRLTKPDKPSTPDKTNNGRRPHG